MTAVAINDITVVDRHRTDLGDLDGLARSMKELGQLQPIVVTTNLRLVAGGRRLAAAKSLGWLEIDAKIVDNLSEASDLLRAERDENTCRQAFRPTEEHSLYAALVALESQARGDRGTSSAPSIKAKASIAEIVTGNPGRHLAGLRARDSHANRPPGSADASKTSPRCRKQPEPPGG